MDNVHAVPPGVDVELWVPQPREQALAGLLEEARNDPPNPGNRNERLPDEGNAERLEAFLAGDRSTVVYFGKLIENKGVQVLLDALREVDARAVIVGFGPYRPKFEQQAEGMPRAVHRAVRAPAPGAPAGVRRRLGGAVDLPRGVRDGRRRVGLGRLPADRRPATPGWRRSRPGWSSLPGRHGAAGGLHQRRQRRAGRADRRGAGAAGRPPRRAARRRPAGPESSGGAGRASRGGSSPRARRSDATCRCRQYPSRRLPPRRADVTQLLETLLFCAMPRC